MPELELLIKDLSSLEIETRADSFEGLRKELAAEIDRLAAMDFEKLIRILYRIDVNEQKLRHLLKQNEGANSGVLIADLIIERQLQKIRSRQSFKGGAESDEEKW